MTAVSYFTDLARAAQHAFAVGFTIIVGCIIFWTVVGCGERHVRRVEHRKEMARWQRQQSRARVVNLTERNDLDRTVRARAAGTTRERARRV